MTAIIDQAAPDLAGVRHRNLAQTWNFRDVGGYQCDDGGTIRWGRLFRSDALGCQATSELAALGVATVIDLRDDAEVADSPAPVADPNSPGGPRVVRRPIMAGSMDVRAFRSGRHFGLADLYRGLVIVHANSLVGVVAEMADRLAEPTVVNCTAGKDRTGLVIALTLLAAGVPRWQVVADYAITERLVPADWRDAMLARLAQVDLHANMAELVGGSPPAALESTLDFISESFGSVDAYLFAHGLSDAKRRALRAHLVEHRLIAA